MSLLYSVELVKEDWTSQDLLELVNFDKCWMGMWTFDF